MMMTSFIPRTLPRERVRSAAFSLLEVVVALGVFVFGITVVIGLFPATARMVSSSEEAEAAANLGDALQVELTARMRQDGFEAVASLLRTADDVAAADARPGLPAHDPRLDGGLLFANRQGTTIAAYDDPRWGGRDDGKFFEITLTRHDVLSPAADDAAASMLAYVARIRCPAFVPDADPANARGALPAGFKPGGPVRFDHGQKQVFLLAGAIVR